MVEAGVVDPVAEVGTFKVPPDLEFLFGVAVGAEKSSNINLASFEPSTPGPEITSGISEMAKADPVPNSFQSIVTSFAGAQVGGLNWKGIINSIQSRLQQNSPALTSTGANALLATLRVIATTNDRATAAIKALGEDGTLHALLAVGLADSENSDLVTSAVTELVRLRGADLSGPPAHPHHGDLKLANDFLKGTREELRIPWAVG